MADFELVQLRKTVEIQLADGIVIQGRRGATLEEFFRILPLEKREIIVGAIANGELHELTYPIEIESRVTPITMQDADGARIYRRSLTFLLEVAFKNLYPNAELTIDHSVTSGGFYCTATGMDKLNDTQLNNLRSEMHRLVAANLPFERLQVPINDAIEYFEQQGNHDKVRLLKYRQKEFLVLYQLDHQRDYHHGYLVPSTGYLKWFDLAEMEDGFILFYPRRFSLGTITPTNPSRQLLSTFKQYGSWLGRLGIESVGALNDAIDEGKIREVILVSEALHEQRIAEIASTIAEKSEEVRIVLISGPSSSGKTTFSKRLAVQLISQGVSPFALEMDNYFVNREDTPKDKDGVFDFEALDALNRPLLNNHLQKLIHGEKVRIPVYNFKAGKSEPGEEVQLQPGQMIILEGIHGLNPDLLPNISSEQTYRIYVSALTQLNLDRHNRISTTDTRLIRRIVRDARERGYSAQQTISRWESVRKGEKDRIFPYQEFANTMFNSALAYELSALKPLVEPLIRQVPFGSLEYIESKRLLAFLDWFLPIEPDLIPDNSIIREFIGGSILSGFKLWKNGS